MGFSGFYDLLNKVAQFLTEQPEIKIWNTNWPKILRFYFMKKISLFSKKMRKIFWIQYSCYELSMLSGPLFLLPLSESSLLDDSLEPVGKKKFWGASLHFWGERNLHVVSLYFVKISKYNTTQEYLLWVHCKWETHVKF